MCGKRTSAFDPGSCKIVSYDFLHFSVKKHYAKQQVGIIQIKKDKLKRGKSGVKVMTFDDYVEETSSVGRGS
eukprot:Pgem_evm1s8818